MIGMAGPAFGASEDVSHPRPGRLDRASRLFLAAAQKALPARRDGTLGIYVATEHGAFAANAEHWGHVLANGPHAVSPLVFPATVPSAAAGEAAIALGAMGPNITICGGAEAARAIVAMAAAAVKDGECAAAVCGVVIGGHPALARIEEVVDGAACAYLDGSRFQVEPVNSRSPLFMAFFDAIDGLGRDG